MIELDRIYNMDCLEGMKQIPDNTIDLIVTSPPYNNFRNRRTQAGREDYWKRTNIIYDCFSDKMTDEDYAEWQIKCINEMVRIIKPTGTIAYNHKDRIFNFEVLSPLTWILKTNAKYRQRITWDRCGMQAYNPVRFYRCEEDIYILGKGDNFKWNKSAAKYLSIWKIPPTVNKDFPCSFPEEIPKRCIEAFTDEGDVVLDPFAGSGTTAYVSLVMNRHYIGFEISQEYVDKAIRRIEQETMQMKLF